MAKVFDENRLQELAESDHKELETFYRRMRYIKDFITGINEEYTRKGIPPSFDKIQALHLLSIDIFEELERYLIPACDPEVAVNPVEREH